MEFIKPYLNWIYFFFGVILDIIGFILSKPITKKTVAIWSKYFAVGDSRYMKGESGERKVTVISWGGIIVFLVGLIITFLSGYELFFSKVN